jgi:hypothetical protein
MSLVHADEPLVGSLLVQVEVAVLQYWSELQPFLVAVPQAPVPLHAEVMTPVKSVEHVLGQATSDAGYTQSGCVPSHFMVPQVPEPVHAVRGVVTDLQVPGVCLHDWQLPVHCMLQQ